jgi:hypothetical protein
MEQLEVCGGVLLIEFRLVSPDFGASHVYSALLHIALKPGTSPLSDMLEQKLEPGGSNCQAEDSKMT